MVRLRSGKGKKGEEIVAAYIPYNSAGRETPRTILFSHGNAVDLGQMLPFYRCLPLQSLLINKLQRRYQRSSCVVAAAAAACCLHV